jgi:hypothetical protein
LLAGNAQPTTIVPRAYNDESTTRLFVKAPSQLTQSHHFVKKFRFQCFVSM